MTAIGGPHMEGLTVPPNPSKLPVYTLLYFCLINYYYFPVIQFLHI